MFRVGHLDENCVWHKANGILLLNALYIFECDGDIVRAIEDIGVETNILAGEKHLALHDDVLLDRARKCYTDCVSSITYMNLTGLHLMTVSPMKYSCGNIL